MTWDSARWWINDKEILRLLSCYTDSPIFPNSFLKQSASFNKAPLPLLSLTCVYGLFSPLILVSSTSHQLSCPSQHCCPASPPRCLALMGLTKLVFPQHDSSSLSWLFFRYFQACFSHSHWLSQPKWHEQTSLQGPFPHALGGLRAPHIGKGCWDWGPCGLFSYGLTHSQGDVKVMNWEEPVAVAVLIFSLSSWHKLHHYSWGFYISDLENPKLFCYQPRFLFCSLAGSELFLWWSRWFTLSSSLFVISWHLVLSFLFMVRCFAFLWIFSNKIPFFFF